jgi:hypothetical protein
VAAIVPALRIPWNFLHASPEHLSPFRDLLIRDCLFFGCAGPLEGLARNITCRRSTGRLRGVRRFRLLGRRPPRIPIFKILRFFFSESIFRESCFAAKPGFEARRNLARYHGETWWHSEIRIWKFPSSFGVATTTADFEDADPFEPSKSLKNARFGKMRLGGNFFPSGPRYKLARLLIVLAIETKGDLLNQPPVCVRNPTIGSPSQPCLARLLEAFVAEIIPFYPLGLTFRASTG